MTKRIISVLLCVMTVFSVFIIVPVSNAKAASHKDSIIEKIIEYDEYWYDKSYFSKKGYYGYGTGEFIDFDFDGNPEFVLTYPSVNNRIVYHDVMIYKDGDLHYMLGNENDGYGGYYGNELKTYYSKNSGGMFYRGNATYYESSNAWIQQNFSIDINNGKIDVGYYSGKLYVDGETTYFGYSPAYCDLNGSKAISSKKYKSLNKISSSIIELNVQSKKINLNKWYSYSEKKKKALLSESYDAFKLSTSVLSTPSLPTYESRGNHVILKWKAVSGAKYYRVYRKESADGKWKSMGIVDDTRFTDYKVEQGKKYIYTIRCVNDTGKYNLSSYNKTGKTVLNLKTPEITKLGNAKDGVKITWGKVSGAEKYRVYVNKGGTWKTIGNTTSTSFVHKDVESNKTYKYTVRCTSKSGKTFTSMYNNTGWSTKYIATPVLSKVASVTEGVKINWNAVDGAQNYQVYVKGGEFKKWTKVGDTTDTSLVHLQPASGVKYTYTVACMNADCTERVSSFDSKGLSINYIASPVITSGEVTEKGIKLTWDKVDGAQKYRVFVKSGSKWKKLKDTTSQSFTHKNLTEGNSYTYTVRCISSNGKSYTSAYNKDGWTFDYVFELPTEVETECPTEFATEVQMQEDLVETE